MEGYYTTFIRKMEDTVRMGVCREFSILTILLLYTGYVFSYVRYIECTVLR